MEPQEDDPVTVLWDAAEEAIRTNNIVAGIKCLEAVVQSKSGGVLPQQEGRTRLRIAEVLLEHTVNHEEARDHLEKSIVLLSGAGHHVSLWLKGHAHLIALYDHSSQHSPLVKSLLKQAIDGAMSSPMWWYYFILRTADVLVREQNYSLAKSYLLSGLDHSKNTQNYIYQVLFLLSVFQISLLEWDFSGAVATKQDLETALLSVDLSQDYVNGTLAEYYFLLLTTWQNLRIGNTKDLSISLSALKKKHIDFHTKVNGASTSDNIPFSYLDNHGIMNVTLNLVFAIATRPGNFQQSIQSIEAGISGADGLIQSGKLNAHQFRSVIRLKFHLHENLFYVKLTQYELESALLQIKLCHELFAMNRIQGQTQGDDIGGVGGFASTIHVMCCLMAHTCGQFDVALAHVKLAIQKTKQESIQSICMLYMMLIYLQIGAIETVEQLILQYSARLQAHPQTTIKVLATFVEGCTLQMRGVNNEDARKKMSESLSYGQSLSNTQATAQILNGLTKIFLQQTRDSINIINNNNIQFFPPEMNVGDPNHPNNPSKLLQMAKDISNSAVKLAHHMGDIGCQVLSLKALKNLYIMTNDNSPQAHQHLAFLQQREFVHQQKLASIPQSVDFLLLRNLLQQ